MQFGTVALSIGAVIILALPGFLLSKAKLVDERAIHTLTSLLLYVTSPLLTFINFQESVYTEETLISLMWMSVMCIVFYVVMCSIALLIVKPRNAQLSKRVAGFMSVFPNGGFMGIPVLQSLFPNQPEPILYAAVAVAFFNFFVWTLGGYILTGDKKFISPRKALLNPATISIVVSVPLFILGLKINDVAPPLHNALRLMGNCTTPLAMTILGIRLANVPLKNIFADKKVYLVSALKLVAVPLLTYLIIQLFGHVNPVAVSVIFIVSAMPSATMGVVFSEKFLGDGAFATACFVNSTLLSILTVSLMLMIFL